jgi:AcrR family transcriptional regulator
MSADAAAARGRLSAELIVATAVRIIEAEGEAAASMRRIAAELDVAAMSLYNHVPNKAALLDLVADWVGAQIELPRGPGEDWEARARTLLHAFRDVVRQYPNCMQLSMSRANMSSVALVPLEYALEMAHEAGYPEADAIRLIRAFTSYVIGSITTENTRRSAMQAIADGGELPPPIPVERFPHLAALGPRLFVLDPDTDFEFGINLLLGALRRG